jgi:hypothetical protein
MKLLILLFIITKIKSYVHRDLFTSCLRIKNPSPDNCGFASIEDNTRCCYVEWENESIKGNYTNTNRECYLLENKLKVFKQFAKDRKNNNFGKTKVICSSLFIKGNLIFLFFFLFILFF